MLNQGYASPRGQPTHRCRKPLPVDRRSRNRRHHRCFPSLPKSESSSLPSNATEIILIAAFRRYRNQSHHTVISLPSAPSSLLGGRAALSPQVSPPSQQSSHPPHSNHHAPLTAIITSPSQQSSRPPHSNHHIPLTAIITSPHSNHHIPLTAIITSPSQLSSHPPHSNHHTPLTAIRGNRTRGRW